MNSFEFNQCGKVLKEKRTLRTHMETIHNPLCMFKCTFCSKICNQQVNLDKHMLAHTGEKPYECEKCEDTFADSSQLKAHLKRKHASTRDSFDCMFCYKTFKSGVLLTHFFIHTGERPFFCRHCSKELRSGEALRYHEELHSPEPTKGSFSCSFCERYFKSKQKLNHHLAVHLAERPFKCNLCQNTFKTKNALKNHFQVHDNLLPYKCPHCEKAFKRPVALKLHLRATHENKKPFECTFCSKSFNQKIHLEAHFGQHTSEKPYSCEICERGFLTTTKLGQHSIAETITLHYDSYKTIAEEDMMQCPECGMKFKRKVNLRHHRQVHRDKLLKCSVCLKMFRTRKSLRVHLQSHTMEKSFKCRICGKSFGTSNNRKTHEKVHFPQQYKCKICSREFHRRGDLKKHMLSHGKGCKKLFGCLFCPKMFLFREPFVTHVKSHLNEKPYICKLCQREFSCSKSLKKHTRDLCLYNKGFK